MRFLSVVFGASFLSACASVSISALVQAEIPAKPYSVEYLDACPKWQNPTDKEFVVFDGRTNLLKGWNHADQRPEYKSLTHPAATYNVGPDSWVASDDCDGEKVFSAVLLKKLGSWQRNHSSGIEPHFERANLTFGDVQAIVLEFKVDNTHSNLPSQETIQQAFSFAAEPARLNTLDSQQYAFGITVFAPGFADQKTETLNVQTRIVLSPVSEADRWLRVVLPLEAANVYLEKDYSPTSVELAQYGSETLIGLRINPETTSGKLARHLNPNAWLNAERSELFKEMAISLRRVTLQLK